MINYELNLLRPVPKSKAGLIGGVLMIIWGLTLVFFLVILKRTEHYGLWAINSTWFIFYGSFLAYSSQGKDIRSILGKAFLRITPEELVFKTGVLTAQQTYLWSNIQTISQAGTRVKIILKTGKTELIHLKEVEFQLIQQIKEKLAQACREQGVGYELK